MASQHRRSRDVPHPTGARVRDLAEETNTRRRVRRFGDPADSGLAGRGRADWPQLRAKLMGEKRGVKRIGAKDLVTPSRPAICFLYEDLADLAELERPEPVFGMYPAAFLPKILPWLKCDRRRLVHVCSGGLPPGEGIRVDVRPEAKPDIIADGRDLPFEDGSVEALLLDPPYTEHYARDLYGTEYPRPAHLLKEAARVVKPCGRIGFVHYITPNPPPPLPCREGLRPLDGVRVPDAGGHDLRARAGLAPGGLLMALRLRPWTVKKALPFVRDVHRRLPRVQGALWAVSIREELEVVGVALVGHPAREWMEDDATLAVIRVAVREGHANGCSMLYGACSRAARAMGAENLVTYTHIDEPGTSLRAAGWVDGGLTKGEEQNRPSRRRGPVVDARPKRRWWAPWSAKAQALLAAREVA